MSRSSRSKTSPLISRIISWGLKGVLIALFIFSTFAGQFPLNITVLVAVFIAFTPTFIARSYKFHFPVLVDIIITVAILLDVIGRVFRLYHTEAYWWWDIMTHFTGSATISLVAFYIIFMLIYLKKIKISYWMVAVFIFSFTMMIGALWEISEFYFDLIFGYNTYLNEPNSIRDMLFDLFGGLIVATLGAIYTRYVMTSKSKDHIFA